MADIEINKDISINEQMAKIIHQQTYDKGETPGPFEPLLYIRVV